MKNIFVNISILAVTALAVIIGGFAITKIIRKADVTISQLPDTTTPITTSPFPSETPTPEMTQNTSSSTTTTSSRNATTSSTTFTIASLATHNKAGNCYVAYNKLVYNVSNHPVWARCTHHGVRGGIDISAIFPHPTSFLASLPKVGTLPSGATGSSHPIGLDDDDNEIEID